jgi:hypothetical protein
MPWRSDRDDHGMLEKRFLDVILRFSWAVSVIDAR